MARINGNGKANRLKGTSTADVLNGRGGNDTLDGAGGNDRLVGRGGNDTYIVTATSGTDTIVETASGGLADTVRSTITYTLAVADRRNIENLTLAGRRAINGTGNDLDNQLTGNPRKNRLAGGKGDDTLGGGKGSDTLSGGDGNDSLNGGLGSDSMAGGAGDDTYEVNGTGDSVTESAGQGTDTVRSSVSLGLSGEVENLVLLGGAQFGTGNALANVITGTAGSNRLSGLGGNDEIAGGDGSDTLAGGDGNDTLAGGTGNDTLAGGNGHDRLQGGSGSDTLDGSAGNDTLEGGAGNDTLAGGSGNDSLHGGSGADTLDGGAGDDVLVWDGADARVDGGIGTDTVQLTGSTSLDLVTEDTGILGTEVIDLAGANTLTVAPAGVKGLSDSTDTLLVKGGAGDAVIGGGGWSHLANHEEGGQTYAEYAKDGATVRVDVDIDRDAVGVAVMSLGVLDGGNGFRIDGVAGADYSGISVASAGDIDGDGLADLIIGSDPGGAYALNAGAAYIVYGGAVSASGLMLSSLDGASGFRLEGVTGDNAGFSAAAAGDVNGDGYGDVIVGAFAANGYAGASYVVFGGSTLALGPALSALDGSNGFRLDGAAANETSGRSVSSAGDVNGDGYDDLLVGAPDLNGTGPGAAYVVYGRSDFDPSVALSALDGSDGFRLEGVAAYDQAGHAVASAGDVNGDGLADLLVGAPSAAGFAGETYLVLGGSNLASNIELSALDGGDGFRIDGVRAFDLSGGSVAPAGDVNGDGYVDFVIGAPSAGDGYAGEAYVVFGGASFGSSLAPGALDGSSGFRLAGIDPVDQAGISVASAGDVNADGYDDLVIGASQADPGGRLGAGETYVVFGRGSFDSTVNLGELDGTTGFRLEGIGGGNEPLPPPGDRSGTSVASGGDVNGDGYADLLIGAPLTPGTAVGATFVVYGRDYTAGVTHEGTSGADSLTGTGAADIMVGGAGDDTLAAGAGEDVVRGGAGDDRIGIGAPDFFDVDGGAGRDTLALGGGITLDLTDLPDHRLTGIEIVDLGGAGADTLVLDALEVANLSPTDNTLRVDGDAADAVVAGAGWTRIAETMIGGQSYEQFTQGAITLQVDGDVDLDIGVAVMNLSLLDGTLGFRLEGVGTQDTSGYSVSSAGDVDGDGYDDVIVGAPRAGGEAGESYVVYGGSSLGPALDLGGLDGNDGFLLAGIDGGDRSGWSVSTAGDVNGDGYADLVIGAPQASPDGIASGETYVVFGGSDLGASVDLGALGAGGFRLDGIDAVDQAGFSVAAAGDFNGDGLDDLVIGAPYAYAGATMLAGQSYVVFGSGAFGASIDLGALGTGGLTLLGIAESDYSGFSIASAGDVDGDGYDDVIIGAPNANGLAGESYVVYGGASPAATLELSTLDGTEGFRLTGGAAGDKAGLSVASAGDVNGDGYADLVIGAFLADPGGSESGATYVVFGGSSPGASVDLDALDGDTGFRLDGSAAGDLSGYSVAAAGDFNGDGYDDLVLGARGANGATGATYVVFGGTAFSPAMSLDELDGSNGLRLDGVSANDSSGRSVASAGDVNGDGFDDLLIGASLATVGGNPNAGVTYVVYGGDFTGAVTAPGTAGSDNLAGTSDGDVLVAGLGNDLLNGGGGADVFRGGAGDDRIEIADAGFLDIDGGSGLDTLAVTGDFHLDLGATGDRKVTGIEVIDLTGADAELTIELGDLLHLAGDGYTLTIEGDGADVVNIVVGGLSAPVPQGDYNLYTAGANVKLLVDADITPVITS